MPNICGDCAFIYRVAVQTWGCKEKHNQECLPGIREVRPEYKACGFFKKEVKTNDSRRHTDSSQGMGRRVER